MLRAVEAWELGKARGISGARAMDGRDCAARLLRGAHSCSLVVAGKATG